MASANTSPPTREGTPSGRPPVSELDAARTSARDAVRRETAALLGQRIRSGLCFLLIALAPFASYELSRASHELLPFAIVKVVQLGTIFVAFLLLRIRSGWHGYVAIGLATLATIFGTTAMTGVLAHQALATVALAIGLSMGTAMLLPWGVGPQCAVVALGALAAGVNLVFVTGIDGFWEPPLVCVVLAGLSSVCAAREFEAHRIARRLLEETSIELRVAEQAGDSLTLPRLLERICRLAVDLAPADQAAIYLWSERFGRFVPAAEYGTPATVAARVTMQAGLPDAITRELREGRSVVLSRGTARDADEARGLDEAELAALAIEPLAGRDRPLGFLLLGLRREPAFCEASLAVVRSVAAQAATQIEKARLFTKAQKAGTFRARLVELGAAVAAASDATAIAQALCAGGAALFEVSGGALFRREGDVLVATATSPGDGEPPTLELALGGAPSPLGRALAEGRPWFANDVRATALAEHPIVRTLGLESLLVIPLAGQGGLLGVLVYGDSARTHAFSPAIAEEAVLLAGIGVAAFERAHYAQVEQARHYAERHAAALARYAAELAKARNAALDSARAKTEFLANMSHEIRTPMTAILGYVRLLSERATFDEEHTEYLATIRRNGEHLLRILNDILDLSKIDAGRMTLERVACSPADLVNEVASLMRSRAIEKGLDLTVQYRSPIPAHIEADPTRLRQILLNLVGNAVKFTDAGRVTIAAELVPHTDGTGEIRIIVADTGCGISEEAHAALFQAFAQGDTSTTRTSGGTGLGLAISQRLAHMLGGDITVESAADAGSTFTLCLATGPLEGVEIIAHPAEVVRPTTPARQPRRLPPRTRVLLVEDAIDNQKLLAFHLREAGADVQVASDGITACELTMDAVASGLAYDVVLMDVQMPRLDGYHATARLRGMGYDGVIVALTAHAMGAERQRCLDAGCNDFLSKPVEAAELVDTIAKYVAAPPATGTDRRPAAGAAGAGPAEPPLVSHLAGSEGLEDLLREFVEGLPERVAAMERDFLASDLKSLAARSHQLKGTAGAYGFPVLTEAARELETVLKAGRSGRDLRAKLDRIAALCRRATHRAPPTDAERRLAAVT